MAYVGLHGSQISSNQDPCPNIPVWCSILLRYSPCLCKKTDLMTWKMIYLIAHLFSFNNDTILNLTQCLVCLSVFVPDPSFLLIFVVSFSLFSLVYLLCLRRISGDATIPGCSHEVNDGHSDEVINLFMSCSIPLA